jgi:hypothetical protein
MPAVGFQKREIPTRFCHPVGQLLSGLHCQYALTMRAEAVAPHAFLLLPTGSRLPSLGRFRRSQTRYSLFNKNIWDSQCHRL